MSSSCGVPTCQARATFQCFECGLWLCEAHLRQVQMPTASGYFAERLCSVCLESHIDAPDRYGFVIEGASDVSMSPGNTPDIPTNTTAAAAR